MIVALGATAVSALLGPSVRVLANRGHVIDGALGPCLVTVHPSSILRAADDEARRVAYEAFVADLREARRFLPGE